MIIIKMKIEALGRIMEGKSLIKDGTIATTYTDPLVTERVFENISKTDKTAKLVDGTIIQHDKRNDEEIAKSIINDLKKQKILYGNKMQISWEIQKA
jgi:hypothetical protein